MLNDDFNDKIFDNEPEINDSNHNIVLLVIKIQLQRIYYTIRKI